MQEFYLSWATEYATGETEIDKNFQKIIEAGLIMYQYIHYGNLAQDKILEVARGINKVILRQMEIEIALLNSYLPKEVKEHEKDHFKLKLRFDLEEKYEVSDRMRIIMSAKMIKEYISDHFFSYDIPDLQKLKDKFDGFGLRDVAS